jgi:hypothetical protein
MAISPAELTSKIVALLDKAESKDRRRIISAAMILLGEKPSDESELGSAPDKADVSDTRRDGRQAKDAAGYFNEKDPTSKIEELAVAARFRETTLRAQTHSKQELEAVFKNARRNFDSKNFGRDTINAKTKGFFNKGGDRGLLTLAYYGQQFVDALPERDEVKKMRRPKGAGRKTSKKSKAK